MAISCWNCSGVRVIPVAPAGAGAGAVAWASSSNSTARSLARVASLAADDSGVLPWVMALGNPGVWRNSWRASISLDINSS